MRPVCKNEVKKQSEKETFPVYVKTGRKEQSLTLEDANSELEVNGAKRQEERCSGISQNKKENLYINHNHNQTHP